MLAKITSYVKAPMGTYIMLTSGDPNGSVIAQSNVADCGVSQGIQESREEVLHRHTFHDVMLEGKEVHLFKSNTVYTHVQCI